MPTTLNVADKPTLNSVKTDTDTLLTRGGIRHNGTNPQVYDPTNETWVDLSAGGSLSPTIIIKNHFYEDGDMDNLDITVSDVDEIWTTTVNMGTGSSITVEVPWLDTYIVTFSISGSFIRGSVDVIYVGGTICDNFFKIVSWATGTDEEIVDIIQASDNGLIDLVTDAGWAVGDTRSVNISSIATSGTFNNMTWSVGESHVAQTIDLVLMDIGRTSETSAKYDNTAASNYELLYPVKNKDGTQRNNPAFIVGVKNVLSDGATAEDGYMNSTNTNSGSWSSSARRKWCDGGFMSALPETLRPIFKQTYVLYANSYNGTSVSKTAEYCMLFAAGEIFGGQPSGTSSIGSAASYYSNNAEFNALKQVEWYKTSSNRIKKKNNGQGYTTSWWQRSPYYNDSKMFLYVSSTGNTPTNGSNASNKNSISPALFI